MLEEKLESWKRRGLQRDLQPLKRLSGGRIARTGKIYWDFSSNDYLGLNFELELQQAYCEGINLYGFGSGGSTMVTGYDEQKYQLEQEFANFLGLEKSLFFSSGYVANLSILSLYQDQDVEVFVDKFSHASIYDGLKSFNIPFKRFFHGDVNHLKQLLEKANSKQKLIISEGVFSMTGNIAPIKELIQLKEHYQCLLMIDDAHAIGVLGEKGEGSVAALSVHERRKIDILNAPLGKAFSSSGALVCASEQLIEGLRQFARPFIYSTALAPSVVYGIRKTLPLIEGAHDKRKKLHENVRLFRSKLLNIPWLLPSKTPIQLVVLGDNFKALNLSEELVRRGFFCHPMRRPTVPKVQTGLRVVLSAAHPSKVVMNFAENIVDICQSWT